jgi:hypothetical protein
LIYGAGDPDQTGDIQLGTWRSIENKEQGVHPELVPAIENLGVLEGALLPSNCAINRF